MMKIICTLAIVLICVAYANGSKARIVGGNFSPELLFPYQVSLQRYGGHTCGGSILNSKWILTAAHCVVDDGSIEPQPAAQFNIQAGSTTLNEGGLRRQVKKIVVHKGYGNFLNDLALLELSEPLVMSRAVKEIPLMENDVSENKNILISGWGRVGTKEKISQVLKYNLSRAIGQSECGKLMGRVGNNPEIICLAKERGNGACMGDSGGPAAYDGKLVGVASFVMGGCGSSNPDAYVRVSHFTKWIRENMK